MSNALDDIRNTRAKEIFDGGIIDYEGREIDTLLEEIAALTARCEAFRAALDDLYSVQNGCPLPKYQADWDKAMLDAGRLLGYRIGLSAADRGVE